ncbi:hypothetical protein ACFSHR_09280 [Azotobacter chroococcum]
MEQQPDYRVGNHAAQPQVPQLFNQAPAILAAAAADVHNPLQEAVLLALVAQARSLQPAERLSQAPGEAGEFVLGAAEDFEVVANPIRVAVEAYFCRVIDSGERLSALEYRAQHDLPWEAESWLYQVIGGYEGLPEEQKECFELAPDGEHHSLYSGNFIIRDVKLCLIL